MRSLICTLCLLAFFTSATTLHARQFVPNELKVLISAANVEDMSITAARCGSRVKESLTEESGRGTWYLVEVTHQTLVSAIKCWLDLPDVEKVQLNYIGKPKR